LTDTGHSLDRGSTHARYRLAALATSAEPAKPAFRKIQVPTKRSRSRRGKLSPDGTRVSFIRPDQTTGAWEVLVMPRDGEPRRVTTSADRVQMGSLAWSPDGQRIAFGATSGGEHDLWLMEDFIHLVKAGRCGGLSCVIMSSLFLYY
jgi:dipeptidyl aminopeptidase/acylaminoacyl peptidase